MAQAKAPTDIGRLPLQVLAQVVKHLSPQERAACAEVHSSWRAAAAIANNSISIQENLWRSNHRKITALQLHLQSHATAVDSLTVVGDSSCELLFPVLELTGLRKLDLKGARLRTVRHGEGLSDVAVLPQEWSCLTHLGLNKCFMELGGLPHLTALQCLELNLDIHPAYLPSTAAHDEQLSLVAADLPRLQRLTRLQLAEQLAVDRAMAAVQHLPNLQDLLLQHARCTQASFTVLPATLTMLQLNMISSYALGLHPDQQLLLSTSTTPGLTQLTALQHLQLGHVTVQCDMLSSYPKLRHLCLSDTCGVRASASGVGLAVMSSLTALQHLALDVLRTNAPQPLQAADVAALAACSQLTHLSIRKGFVPQDQYIELFPAGRILPQLRELYATAALLEDEDTLEALVRCCPELHMVNLAHSVSGEGLGQMVSWEQDHHRSVVLLSGLSKLTRLVVYASGGPFGSYFWKSLAELTTLHELMVDNLDVDEVPGVMALTSCQQLTRIALATGDMDFDVTNQAPAGSPPDVWRKLPGSVLQFAVDNFDEDMQEGWEDGDNRALRCMARAAAAHSLEVQRMQAHQQLQHEQAVRHEAEQKLQQEVAELKAVVAALSGQVQSLAKMVVVQQQQ